jgi:phage terminase Nu1 subunit (DNA packaging protein)
MTRGTEVSREKCAEIFGVARSTLDGWVASGCPVAKPSPRRGVTAGYNTADVFAWRLEQVKLAMGGGALDLNSERARLARLQADGQEMRNEQLAGRLVDVATYEAQLDRAFAVVRAKLFAMPHRLAPLVRPDAPAAAYPIIRAHVEEMMTELRTAGDEVADDAA